VPSSVPPSGPGAAGSKISSAFGHGEDQALFSINWQKASRTFDRRRESVPMGNPTC
jgi:hypothetical protein